MFLLQLRYSAFCGLLAIAAGFTFSASRAQANVILTFEGVEPGTNAVNLSGNGGASYEDVYSGVYLSRVKTTTHPIFCVDFNHEVVDGQQYDVDAQYLATAAPGPLVNGYYQGGLASVLVAGDYGPVLSVQAAEERASEVTWLGANYLTVSQNYFDTDASGDTSYTDNETGISLSIWDIMQDGGDGIYSGEGSIVADSSAQTAYGSLVTYYEAQAAQHTDYTNNYIHWEQAPMSNGTHSQEFIGVLPEPSGLEAFACMAGVLGVVALRRRLTARSL